MKKQNSTRVQALKKMLSFIAVISFSLSTSAQKKWSLKDCVDHAMEQNISIKLAKLDIWSAEEDVVTARANFYQHFQRLPHKFIILVFLSDKTGRVLKVILEEITLV